MTEDETRPWQGPRSNIFEDRKMTNIAKAAPEGNPGIYVVSDIKRRERRTKLEMATIRNAIIANINEINPQTVRGVFYQMVGAEIVPKVEDRKGYGTVQRILFELRMAGDEKRRLAHELGIEYVADELLGIDNPDLSKSAAAILGKPSIPFDFIADNTRWMRKPTTHSGAKAAIEATAECYRRALWHDSDVYVEIWVEKDTVAGVIMEETEPFDVPLMVARGFSSLTFLYNSARAIADRGKPAHIYHCGDHDPSGRVSARAIERTLRRFAPEVEINFECIAVTPEQIEEWNLPTRPTKRNKNTHAKGFVGDSVELDAIPADKLRGLVRSCIERHIDKKKLEITKIAELSERKFLADLAGRLAP
jgi:hypothetical protein